MKIPRRNKSAAAILMGVVLLAGCASGGDAGSSSGTGIDDDVQSAYDSFVKEQMPSITVEMLQSAKDEGEVTYYHGQTGLDADLLKEFQEQFPFIRLGDVSLAGGELVTRFNSEYLAGQYLADVVYFSSFGAASAAQQDGLVMEYPIGPAADIDPNYTVADYVYPLYFDAQAIAYNPATVSEDVAQGFATWDGLESPDLDGLKIGIQDPTIGGSPGAVSQVQYDQSGTGIWDAIKPGSIEFSSVSNMTAAVISGEIDLTAGGSAGIAELNYNKGAQIRWAYPTPIVLVPFGQFIAAEAPHPNAAKLLQEFTFSETGQQYYVDAGQISYLTSIDGSTRPVASESWYADPDLDDIWSSEDAPPMDEVVQEWNSIFR